MYDDDDGIINLNLSETGENKYGLKCPNCQSSNFRKVRIDDQSRGSFMASIVEHNVCYICNTKFNDYEETLTVDPIIKGILIVIITFVLVFTVVIIVGLISSL
jgi:DNA-directed RNA polymerase subunit RPC12/RpoP